MPFEPGIVTNVLNKTASTATMVTVARAFAVHKGWKGSRSGWIFNPKTGRTIEQGYHGLYIKCYREICEWLTTPAVADGPLEQHKLF